MLDSLLTLREAVLDDMPPHRHKKRKVNWILKVNGAHASLISTDSKADLPNTGRTSNIAPALISDKAQYVLGVHPSNPDRGAQCHKAYVELLEAAAEDIPDLQKLIDVLPSIDTPENIKRNDFVIVKIDGDLMHDRTDVQDWWVDYMQETYDLTGNDGFVYAEIPQKHTQIRRFGNALSSYNDKAYESYGLAKSENAWLTKSTQHALNTTLSYLIDHDDHCYRVNETHWIWWSKEPGQFVTLNPILEGDSNYARDIFGAITSGHQFDVKDVWLMGLQENQGRLIVRHVSKTTTLQLKRQIATYLQQITVGSKPSKLYAMLIDLVRTASGSETFNDIQPWMEDVFMQTALTGQALPYNLLMTALGRVFAVGEVTHALASTLKLYLLTNNKTMSKTLNKNHPDPAYHAGRLFSVLEKLQEDALGTTNASITDKYFRSAASTPKSVFGKLLSGAQAHLSKLRKKNRGFYIKTQKSIQEILSNIQKFPTTLTAEGQANFCLGYYHQLDDIYTKSDSDE